MTGIENMTVLTSNVSVNNEKKTLKNAPGLKHLALLLRQSTPLTVLTRLNAQRTKRKALTARMFAIDEKVEDEENDNIPAEGRNNRRYRHLVIHPGLEWACIIFMILLLGFCLMYLSVKVERARLDRCRNRRLAHC